MKKRKLPKPTEGELAILRVLWRRGRGTVREVHTELGAIQNAGYTTVLKLMQIMAEKGLVTRNESQKSHVYTPVMTEKEVQRRFLRDLLDRLFDGSAHQLVLQALSTRKASPEEVAGIRKLLDDMGKGVK